MPVTPPPLPRRQGAAIKRFDKWIALTLVFAFVSALGTALLSSGVIRSFVVSTGSMSPAVSAGDRVVMEGITFFKRKPRRGDIVAFKTDGISSSLVRNEIFMKRIAGEPGEHLRIADGKLFINGKEVELTNIEGKIKYASWANGFTPYTDLTVPAESYFVLGDNSEHSSDSRMWGCVPRQNIIGRVNYRYWPPGRSGNVK
jgi:signal peptidase I